MKYDFTSMMDRKGKDAIAVDVIPFPGAEVENGFDRREQRRCYFVLTLGKGIACGTVSFGPVNFSGLIQPAL